MTPTRPIPSRRDSLWIAGLSIGLPLLAMSLLGVDANWDLRNYHLYNVHAWLAGRGHDIAPAMVQSWHNPLLDLPMYLLFTSGLPARATSLWLTLPTIAAIAFLLMLQRALSLDPDLHQARFGLAIAYAPTAQRAEAAREAQELLRRLPPNAPQRPEVERLLAAVR